MASLVLFGRHAVEAALKNPKRRFGRLMVTKAGMEAVQPLLERRHPKPEIMEARALEKSVPAGAIHQGIVAFVEPLPPIELENVLEEKGRPLVVLDQVTDPHNVGAILRSAAAFDAAAVITPERHAPEATAVLAKSASGALDMVPLVYVSNLASALETIKKAGWWVAGLDGEAPKTLSEAKLGRDTALVLGAEGKGMRRLTAERCDLLVRLPISARMESLNVSNAAAVALYALNAGA